jgi:hypothetical protein
MRLTPENAPAVLAENRFEDFTENFPTCVIFYGPEGEEVKSW